MILTRIIFKDFALYAGKQDVVLTPKAKKPVTIIGGLNGAGKTSFLEGIQVALFGANAPFLRAEKKKYQTYLMSSIHAGKSKSNEAGIVLEFKLKSHQGHDVYVVDRHWQLSGRNSVKENLSVAVNGYVDRMLTDVWSEYVESILPPRLAPLFFFDGEQVERYAKSEATSQVLGIGLKALLGLDLIEQTYKDVATLRGQQRKVIRGVENVQPVDEIMAVINDLEAERSRLTNECGGLENDLYQAQKRLSKLNYELHSRGGDLFEKRELIRSQHQQLKVDQSDIRTRIRELAEEELPLGLIQPLLKEVKEQVDAEKTIKDNQLVLDVLNARDQKLLSVLEGFSERAGEIAREFMTADTDERKQKASGIEVFHSLSADAQSILAGVLNGDLEKVHLELGKNLNKLEAVQSELVQVARQIEMIPDEETIVDLLRKRELEEKEVQDFQRLIARREERKASTEYNLVRTQSRFDKLLSAQLAKENEALEANRVVEFSFLVQDKLDAFKKRLTQKYISTIEENVLASFNSLCRKETFLSAVKIDPESLELTLCDSDGSFILPEKLSAGERQLLVVSILWGLARTANKPIPFVIDTPLGRLDSAHREKLINNFFSTAGHQVVLLSTDEEIDTRWKKKLSSSISHSYLLEYDHKKRATKVRKGYFGGRA